MANKVTMTIAGEEYTFVADENAAYMEKVCGIVDKRMTQLTDAKVIRNDAAVLAAVNLADELLKSQDAAENLRRQIKSYLDEISDLKRQLFKAQNQQGHQQNRK